MAVAAAAAIEKKMVVIISALIGAIGTVLSAGIAVLGVQLKRSVDGQVSELQARVKLLEETLTFAQEGSQPAKAGDPPL